MYVANTIHQLTLGEGVTGRVVQMGFSPRGVREEPSKWPVSRGEKCHQSLAPCFQVRFSAKGRSKKIRIHFMGLPSEVRTG